MKVTVLLLRILLLLGMESLIFGLQALLLSIKLGLESDQISLAFLAIESITILAILISFYILRHLKRSNYKNYLLNTSILLVILTQIGAFSLFIFILPMQGTTFKVLLFSLLFCEKTCEALIIITSASVLSLLSTENSGIYLYTMWYFTLLCTYLGFNSLLYLLVDIDVLVAYPSLLLVFFIISLLNCCKIEESADGVVTVGTDQAVLGKAFCVTVKFI